ncbi:MAG TPA: adenylyl-sulfate kinase [Acidimicrobiales bacterium]
MVDAKPTMFVVWFTGISGAGKSTIASILEQRLLDRGLPVHNLDGDALRLGLNRDLGFTDVDRRENIRRVGELSRLFNNAGMIVLVAAISPFRDGRDRARQLVGPRNFVEVHVDTPLEVAEGRDPKGLYRKARSGQLQNFTGIDSPYEPPLHPEVRVDTGAMSAIEAADEIVRTLVWLNLIVE